jgi:hypothetical protein
MRLTLPRFTVRRLMVAVAIVALGVAAVRLTLSMAALSDDYQRRALSHRIKVADDVFLMLRSPDDPRAGAWLQRRKAYRGAMAEKWNRAALFPWLPVAPDPPEPPLPE